MPEKYIKTAFIANGFGNSPVVSGGEIRLFNIIKRLPPQFKASLFTTRGGAEAAKKHLNTKAINIIQTRSSLFFKKERFTFMRLWSFLLSAIDTVSMMKNTDFDLIYTSSDSFCDTLPAHMYRKKKKTKWVSMVHHVYVPPSKRPGNYAVNLFLYFLQSWTFGLISDAADAVFVLDTPAGSEAERILRGRGFKGGIHRVWNGIELIKNRKFKKDRRMALYVGGLRPAKGLYDIVPIWKKIAAKVPDFILHIVGRGSNRYMSYIKNEIGKNNLSGSIRIEGYVEQSRLVSYYKKSFLFFLPSHEEGWGISAAEALLYNNHVVVYSLPAFKVFGNGVITVRPFDTGEFAEKILKIYKSGRLKNTPVRFINKFDWDILAKKEAGILKSLAVN